jgi:hypothetical protein
VSVEEQAKGNVYTVLQIVYIETERVQGMQLEGVRFRRC